VNQNNRFTGTMIFIVEINIPRILLPNSHDWHDESTQSRRTAYL